MRKFLNTLLWIFIKPISAIVYFSGNDKYLRYVNRHKALKAFFVLLLACFFIFLFLGIPIITHRYNFK